MTKMQFQEAYTSIVNKFPFEGYVDDMVYHEMYSVTCALKKFVSNFQGCKLLDIGSGPMDKTAILQLLGFECFAVDDLSDFWHRRNDNINKIKNFAENVGIHFYHQPEGNFSIPFSEGSFDVVTSLSVIEHLHESPREILNVMGRFLKTEGFLVIVMPNSVNLRKRLSVLLGKTNYNPVDELYFSTDFYRGHVREYTLAETVYMCKLSGFVVVYADTFEHFAYKKLAFPLREIYLGLGRLIKGFRSGILVIAKKPTNWTPVEKDENKYFQAIIKGVPAGIR